MKWKPGPEGCTCITELVIGVGLFGIVVMGPVLAVRTIWPKPLPACEQIRYVKTGALDWICR